MNQTPCAFADKVAQSRIDISPRSVSTLQLNITKMCNQACTHCHVDASPRRKETMSRQVWMACVEFAKNSEINLIDLTGGAPELHPEFSEMVTCFRDIGKQVMVRHNLTVAKDLHPATKESMAWIHGFFAEHKVEVVSSLPFYQEYFTNRQRGDGVFTKSIAALQDLNAIGYGRDGSGLKLHLVYNPAGAFLPPEQKTLEADYKRELRDKFGITFNELYVLTNMPILRFKASLVQKNGYESYMEKLREAFNPHALANIMCRDLISVDHQGQIYDCDFNQMLSLKAEIKTSNILDIVDSGKARRELLGRKIAFGEHCFGCTAGSGSSCGGQLV